MLFVCPQSPACLSERLCPLPVCLFSPSPVCLPSVLRLSICPRSHPQSLSLYLLSITRLSTWPPSPARLLPALHPPPVKLASIPRLCTTWPLSPPVCLPSVSRQFRAVHPLPRLAALNPPLVYLPSIPTCLLAFYPHQYKCLSFSAYLPALHLLPVYQPALPPLSTSQHSLSCLPASPPSPVYQPALPPLSTSQPSLSCLSALPLLSTRQPSLSCLSTKPSLSCLSTSQPSLSCLYTALHPAPVC
jgi:hypothetical protein